MKKRLFALLIMVAMLALVACSSDEGKKDKKEGSSVEDNFNWEMQGQCVAITGVTKKGAALKELVVPSKIDGKKVISIEESALAGSQVVEEIILPDTIRYIGEKAISDCPKLKKVKISNGLEFIRSGAFYGDKELVEINIPDSAIYIEANAFELCEKIKIEDILSDKLTYIEDSGYVNYEILKKDETPEYIANRFDIPPTDEDLFYWEDNGGGTVRVTGVKEKLKEVNIPETINGKKVTSIDHFYDPTRRNTRPEVLIVPSGVEEVACSGIGSEGLKYIKFCGNLITLYGFDSIESLEAVVVPNCNEIRAFSQCGTILYVELPVEMREWNNTSFTFTNIPVLKMPKRVKNLHFTSLMDAGIVIMPESVESIDFRSDYNENTTYVVKEGSEMEEELKKREKIYDCTLKIVYQN